MPNTQLWFHSFGTPNNVVHDDDIIGELCTMQAM